MKRFLGVKKRTLFSLLFFILIATGLLAPIAAENAIPNLADYITHLGGIIQAKMALAQGQFPIRVAPFEQDGLQYPYFQFYSPTGYTFTGLLYQWLTPNNPLIAFKLSIGCALVLGGVYMSRLAYRLTKSRVGALLSGIVYLTAPYYLITVDHLGNLTESLGLGLFPAVLYYTLRCYSHPKEAKAFLQMSLAWYLLATIHIVTFVYASFFSALLLLMISFQHRSHWLSLCWAGLAYLFASALALWYLAPITLLSPYFLLSSTLNSAQLFTQYSPSLSDLLFPAAGITPGSKSALVTIHPALGWPIVLAVSICVYAYFTRSTLSRPHHKTLLPYLLLLFFIAFILAWSPFHLDAHLPKILTIGQYSWRLLSQTLWIGSLLFAWAIAWLFQEKLDQRHLLVGALVLATAANAWFPEVERYEKSVSDVVKTPTLLMAKSAYLLNFNTFPQWINATDSMQIDPLLANNTLQLNTIYRLSKTTIDNTLSPFISLNGTLTNALPGQVISLHFIVNGSIAATKILTNPTVQWNIPLNKGRALDIQFSSTPKNTTTLQVSKLSLSGFQDPQHLITLQQIQTHCRPDHAQIRCRVMVDPNIHLVELPILYYPNLLRITVNGQETAYRSILSDNKLIASIAPVAGKMNDITLEFHGLPWANRVSELAFGLWLCLFILTVFHAILHKKR